MENNTPFVPTITTTDPAAFAAELFEHYWVFSVGAEIYVGREHTHTTLLVVNKNHTDYHDALTIAHSISDEVCEQLIDDNFDELEHMVDWDMYVDDEDELDEDTRFDAIYDEGLANSDCWVEVVESWDEIDRIASGSDKFELWAVEDWYCPETYKYINYLEEMVTKVIGTMGILATAIAAFHNEWDGTSCDDNKNTHTSEKAS